jgi:hypothetical protein
MVAASMMAKLPALLERKPGSSANVHSNHVEKNQSKKRSRYKNETPLHHALHLPSPPFI